MDCDSSTGNEVELPTISEESETIITEEKIELKTEGNAVEIKKVVEETVENLETVEEKEEDGQKDEPEDTESKAEDKEKPESTEAESGEIKADEEEEEPVEKQVEKSLKVSTRASPRKPKAAPAAPTRVQRSRAAKREASVEANDSVVSNASTTTGRGRKRKTSENSAAVSAKRSIRTPAKKNVLHYTDFVRETAGHRVLSCGDGEFLGHPGRTTSKKPRKVDIVEDEDLEIVQVVGGGVHSVILTKNGDVYTCGINEKGTVPGIGIEQEGSTDEFTKIEFSPEIQALGKIVFVTAGASFSAALTDKGSVIAWGNLRDENGKIDSHQQLTGMQKEPIILMQHTKTFVIVKVVAGENHLVMLSQDYQVYTFGDCSMGQLGRSSRIKHIRSSYLAAPEPSKLHVSVVERISPRMVTVKFKNVFADGFWSAFLSTDNRLFVCGLNNFGQLGIKVEEPNADDKDDNRELRIFLATYSEALSGKAWTHIEGVQHLVLRDEDGAIYTIGKNTDNALGLGTWTGKDDDAHWKYDTPQLVTVPGGGLIVGASAKLGASVVWDAAGNAYSWGCDTSGQLGLGIKDDDDKVVGTPQLIQSAHLEGYKIVQAAMSDNHTLFLAEKSK